MTGPISKGRLSDILAARREADRKQKERAAEELATDQAAVARWPVAKVMLTRALALVNQELAPEKMEIHPSAIEEGARGPTDYVLRAAGASGARCRISLDLHGYVRAVYTAGNRESSDGKLIADVDEKWFYDRFVDLVEFGLKS